MAILPKPGMTSDDLPDVHFGNALGLVRPIGVDNTPDDDEELPQTPSDVVALLGFDPAKTSTDDAWEESKHPRAKGGKNGGQFVKRGTGVGTGNTPKAEPVEAPEWHPPATSEVWPGLSPDMMWKRARSIGKDPKGVHSEWLHEALRHLRPGHLNKIDRQYRTAIMVELALRGEVKAKDKPPPVEKKEPPPPTEEKKDPPPEPPAEREKYSKWPRSRDDARDYALQAKSISTDALQEALKYLDPRKNKKDRIYRRMIEVELALRGAGKPPREKREPPPPPPKHEPPPPSQHEPPLIEPGGARDKATPAQVSAMANGKTHPREREFHLASWQHATQETVAALANVFPLREVTVRKGKRAWYMGGVHRIKMNGRPGTEGEGINAATIWRHEFFHALDWNGKYDNKSAELMPIIREEHQALADRVNRNRRDPEARERIEKARTDPHAQSEVLSRLGLTASEMEEFKRDIYQGAVPSVKGKAPDHAVDLVSNVLYGSSPLMEGYGGAHEMDRLCFNDFIGAMTQNMIGRGHSNAYYRRRPTVRAAEMFANYGSLINSKHGKVFRALCHSIAPRTCAEFDRYISQAANGEDRWQKPQSVA